MHKKREKRIETQSEVKTKVRRIEKKNSFDEEEQKNKTKPIKVMLLPVRKFCARLKNTVAGW